jgi:hypothetical protein
LGRRALKGLYTIRPSPELGEEKDEEAVETGEGGGNRVGSRGVRRETSGRNSGGVSAVEKKNSTAVFSGRQRRDCPVLGSKWSFDRRLTDYPCCSGEFKVGGGTIRKSWGL